jgi:hypothetical protein
MIDRMGGGNELLCMIMMGCAVCVQFLTITIGDTGSD